MGIDSEFVDKLIKHALGLEAESTDDLLHDVQEWLVAVGKLEKVKIETIPCDPDCICVKQLDAGTGPIICYRRGRASAIEHATGRIKGKIKFYRSRLEYGFVMADGDNRDIFLHHKYIGNMTPKQLADGAAVTFTVQVCKQGLRVTSILPVEEKATE